MEPGAFDHTIDLATVGIVDLHGKAITDTGFIRRTPLLQESAFDSGSRFWMASTSVDHLVDLATVSTSCSFTSKTSCQLSIR